MKITINNTFHNTTVNVVVKEYPIILSPSQVRRVERELCGMECICGSMWSYNHTEIEGHEYCHFEPILDHRTGQGLGK